MVQWRQNSASPATINGVNFVGGDVWRHIVVTFTETNSILYLDGGVEGTGGGGVLHDTAATALAIGAWTGGGGAYATAAIDDVAIWNRVLTPTEVENLSFQINTPLNLLISPDCMIIDRRNGSITISWRSEGVLQSATDVRGPYQDVPNATSPYNITVGSSSQFYRLRSP